MEFGSFIIYLRISFQITHTQYLNGLCWILLSLLFSFLKCWQNKSPDQRPTCAGAVGETESEWSVWVSRQNGFGHVDGGGRQVDRRFLHLWNCIFCFWENEVTAECMITGIVVAANCPNIFVSLRFVLIFILLQISPKLVFIRMNTSGLICYLCAIHSI